MTERKHSLYALENPVNGRFWDGIAWHDGPGFGASVVLFSQIDAELNLITYKIRQRQGIEAWKVAPSDLRIREYHILETPPSNIIPDHDAIASWAMTFEERLSRVLHIYRESRFDWSSFWAFRLSEKRYANIRYCVEYAPNRRRTTEGLRNLLDECEIPESDILNRDCSVVYGFANLTDIVLLKMRDYLPRVIYDIQEDCFLDVPDPQST